MAPFQTHSCNVLMHGHIITTIVFPILATLYPPFFLKNILVNQVNPIPPSPKQTGLGKTTELIPTTFTIEQYKESLLDMLTFISFKQLCPIPWTQAIPLAVLAYITNSHRSSIFPSFSTKTPQFQP